METENILALCLSIVAIFACVGVGTYVYFDHSQSADISGIVENSLLITSLRTVVSDLKDDIKDIKIPYISPSDLEDLEDYADDFDEIEDNSEDIDELEGRVYDLETDLSDSEEVLECLRTYASAINGTATTRLPSLLACLNSIGA